MYSIIYFYRFCKKILFFLNIILCDNYPMDTFNPQQIKIENSRLLLQYVQKRRQTTRAELARLSGLTRATVSSIVDDLISRGYLAETGYGPSSGGKRPTMLQLDTSSIRFLAVDFSGLKTIKTILSDLQGRICDQKIISLQPDKALAQINDLIMFYAEKNQKSLQAAVLPVRGILTLNRRGIAEDLFPAINEQYLEQLEKKYGFPVFLERNAHSAAYGEWLLGKNRQKKNLIYLSLGKGVSCGIIINGELYRGPLLSAGEIAHINVNPGGELCSCGLQGCLEKEFQEEVILKKMQNLKKRNLSFETVNNFFNDGDKDALSLGNDLAEYAARAIRILFEFINIPDIALGGRFTLFGPTFLEKLQQLLITDSRGMVLKYYRKYLNIYFTGLGPDIIALGANLLLINKFLNFEISKR